MTKKFREIWCVDFIYSQSEGEQPKPVWMVGLELFSQKRVSLGDNELQEQATPPYALDDQALFVAFGATADLGCHLSLGWDLPSAILDLHAEFRVLTNGLVDARGASLLAASQTYRLQSIDAGLKDHMRALAVRGGESSDQELRLLKEYCTADVEVLAALYQRMIPLIDLPRALLRGRYVRALSHVEARGLPIDVEGLDRFRKAWPQLRLSLIRNLDAPTGIYRDGAFSALAFEQWVTDKDISWPRASSGRLMLDDDTFKAMSLRNPAVARLRELRKTLASMRSFKFSVGPDGRSRAPLKPWLARTGRNQPSTSGFLFGLPSWMRGYLRPTPGRALSYIDWSQQEFGIAAALTRDEKMLEAYASGDPYLAFAKQAGSVPEAATQETHPAERANFKACTLAVQYGMGVDALAARICQSPAHAALLLRQHRDTYGKFWAWSDRIYEYAICHKKLTASFGWTIQIDDAVNERSVRNFPMQANGSEMMRIACFLAVEAGVQVCAPVHDAFVIEAAANEIEGAEQEMRRCMDRASSFVLDGFCLRSDSRRITYPERFIESKGAVMWNQVESLLEDLDKESRQTCCISAPGMGADAHPPFLIEGFIQ